MTVESAATELYQQENLKESLGANTPYTRTGSVSAYPYSKLKQESTYPYSGISFPEEKKKERNYSTSATGAATPFSSVLQGPLGDMSGQEYVEGGQGEDPRMGLPRSYRSSKGGRDGMPGPRSQGAGRPDTAPTQRNLPPAPPARKPQGGRPVGPRSYNSDVMTSEETRTSRRPGDPRAPYDPYGRNQGPATRQGSASNQVPRPNQASGPSQAGEGQRVDRVRPYYVKVDQGFDQGSVSYASDGGATDGSLAQDVGYQTQEGAGFTPTKTRRQNPVRSPQYTVDEEMLDGVGDDYKSFFPGLQNEGEADPQVASASPEPRSSRLARPLEPSQIHGPVAFSDGVPPERTSLIQQNHQRISDSIHESIEQIPKSGGDEFTLQAQVKYEELQRNLADITSDLEKRIEKSSRNQNKNSPENNELMNKVKSLPGLVDDIYDMAGMIVKNEQSLRTENQMALDAYTNSVIDTLAKVTAEKTGLAMTDQLIAEGKEACWTVLQSTMGLTNGLASESKTLVDRYKALDASMSALDGSLKRCAQDLSQFLVSLQALQHRLATYESSAQTTLDKLSNPQ